MFTMNHSKNIVKTIKKTTCSKNNSITPTRKTTETTRVFFVTPQKMVTRFSEISLPQIRHLRLQLHHFHSKSSLLDSNEGRCPSTWDKTTRVLKALTVPGTWGFHSDFLQILSWGEIWNPPYYGGKHHMTRQTFFNGLCKKNWLTRKGDQGMKSKLPTKRFLTPEMDNSSLNLKNGPFSRGSCYNFGGVHILLEMWCRLSVR